MEYRPLDITLISADDVKNVKMFGKMDVYAVAFIFGYPQTKKTTKVDKKCGASPRWNQKLHFTIDVRLVSIPGLTLVINLKADKSLRPDKDIGEVALPISELFKNDNGNDAAAERLVEYQIRTSSGKSKGTLKFSYKFGDKLSYNNGEMKKADEPVLVAYPPPGYRQGQAGASMPAPAAAMAYPPPHPGGIGYQQPPPGCVYPPPPPPHEYYGAYPPSGGHPHPGYGYEPFPGYGYQQPVQQQLPKKKKKNKNKKKQLGGMGMGMGLGAGLLGGMLIGDMLSDMGDMAAYNDGCEAAMEDVTGFDL